MKMNEIEKKINSIDNLLEDLNTVILEIISRNLLVDSLLRQLHDRVNASRKTCMKLRDAIHALNIRGPVSVFCREGKGARSKEMIVGQGKLPREEVER